MNQLAIMEQKKADERMLKLAKDQKREKEKLHQRIIDLQRKLDDKQRLELQIKQMKGDLEVMKHLTDEDVEAKKKRDLIQEDLKNKEEEREFLEAFRQALIVKERKSKDELVDARKELISGLMENTARSHISVKRMGELDGKPFIAAAKRNGSSKKETIKLASLWENHLRDPNWHPFKVITVDGKIKVLPSLREKHDEFMLRELVKRWSNHKVMVRWLSRFFHYLDRYFITRRSLPGLHEVGLTCFCDSVYAKTKGRAKDAVIALINQEREGEQIDRGLLKEGKLQSRSLFAL